MIVLPPSLSFFLSMTQKPRMLSSFGVPCLSFVTVGSTVYMQGWGADCISVSWAWATYKYPAKLPNHQCISVKHSVPSVSGDRTFGLKVFGSCQKVFQYILGYFDVFFQLIGSNNSTRTIWILNILFPIYFAPLHLVCLSDSIK